MGKWPHRQQLCWLPDQHTLTASPSTGTCLGQDEAVSEAPVLLPNLQVQTTWNGFVIHSLFLSWFTSLQNKQKMEVSTNCMFRLLKCVIISHLELGEIKPNEFYTECLSWNCLEVYIIKVQFHTNYTLYKCNSHAVYFKRISLNIVCFGI